MRCLKRCFSVFLSCLIVISSSGVAYALDGLATSTDALLSATKELNELSSLTETMSTSDVDSVFSNVTKTATADLNKLREDVSGVEKSVDSLSAVCTGFSADVTALTTKLSSLDDLNRYGWSFTPPAAGQARGIDIARAAVDLATSAQPDPEYTNPDDPHASHYVDIHDRFLAGEDYKACSVVTSTAIHWSGADPDFPRNTSSIVHKYCADSPKWKFVGHGPDKSEMRPGDVFTSDYHTYMYVGNEVVKERFPFSDADVYTGGNQLPFLYWDSYDNRNYAVYRFVGTG